MRVRLDEVERRRRSLRSRRSARARISCLRMNLRRFSMHLARAQRLLVDLAADVDATCVMPGCSRSQDSLRRLRIRRDRAERLIDLVRDPGGHLAHQIEAPDVREPCLERASALLRRALRREIANDRRRSAGRSRRAPRPPTARSGTYRRSRASPCDLAPDADDARLARREVAAHVARDARSGTAPASASRRAGRARRRPRSRTCRSAAGLNVVIRPCSSITTIASTAASSSARNSAETIAPIGGQSARRRAIRSFRTRAWGKRALRSSRRRCSIAATNTSSEDDDMTNPQRILVVIDPTANAQPALERAASLARNRARTARAVHLRLRPATCWSRARSAPARSARRGGAARSSTCAGCKSSPNL